MNEWANGERGGGGRGDGVTVRMRGNMATLIWFLCLIG